MHLRLAVTFRARLRGQLGRRDPVPMIIAPCSAVHTCILRFPLDLVFLDADLRPLRVLQDVPPWRLRACRGAVAVLELPASGGSSRGSRSGRRA